MNHEVEMQPTESAVEVYERHMVPAIFASWVSALLDLVAPKPGERVLDVACGTGVVARQAASQVGIGGHVVGLDLNGEMLALARALGPAVEWREGNAMALPFATNAFDVVVCQQGLQFSLTAAGLYERRVACLFQAVASLWRFGAPLRAVPGIML
jgi:SAM-dependent methyltransferase